jgi:hypothetical protein
MNKILIAIAMILAVTIASEVIGSSFAPLSRGIELGSPVVSRAAPVMSTPSWRDDWAVRSGSRGAHDWNGDGVIDWRDDRINYGPTAWSGDYVRADWNRDGVVDWQDGWRKLDDTWASGSWDPNWRGEGWRPESVSVREVPAGTYTDTEWRNVDGPWDTQGWGGQSYGVQSYGVDWNRDGVVDFRDSGVVTTGSRVPVSGTRVGAVQSYGVDWNRDGVVDFRDSGVVTTGNRVPVSGPRGGAVQSFGVDLNRDGVVDWRDGGAFTTGSRVPVSGSRVGGVSSRRV